MSRRKFPLSRPERLEDRITPAGALDTAFDTDGKLTFDFGNFDGAATVVVQPDRKIVTLGITNDGGGGVDFAVTRFNPDGKLDDTFAGDGKQTVQFGPSSTAGFDIPKAIALQPDGRIVVVGYTNLNAVGVNVNDFAIARLTSVGELDPSFGSGGTATIDFGGDDQANAVAIDGDKIIVAGAKRDFISGSADFAVARLNASNGQLDGTFGTGGKQTVFFGATAATNSEAANAVAVRDGKIVLVGSTLPPGLNAKAQVAVARLKTDGSLDPDFGTGGKTTVDFSSTGSHGRGNAVAFQSDGRIVVAGDWDGGRSDFAITRLTKDGQLDTAFGGGGKGGPGPGRANVFFGDSIGSGAEFATGVAVQPDDKIVVGGHTNLNNGPTKLFAAARLTKDGQLDGTFNGNGKQTVAFAADAEARGLALAPDGRVVLAGTSALDHVLARLTGDEADLSVTVTDGVTSVPVGGTVTYTIVVTNTGPDPVTGARFANTIPPNLTGISTLGSLAEGGATGNTAGGPGPINDTLFLPVGGKVTYTVTGTVTGPAGETLTGSALVQVPGVFDPNLTNNAAGDTDTVTPAVSKLQFSAPTYTVGEGGGQVTITVNRVGGSAGEVSVQVAVTPGTAALGSDYNAASGTFRWADGDATPRTFNIAILDDALAEGSETVNLALSDPTGGAVLGSPTAATLTITDNDAPAAGALAFGAPMYTVGEGGGQVTITVARVGGSAGAVSVGYATANGSATAGSDYTSASGTLSWADGDAAPKSFIVTILDDATAEGLETFTAALSNPTGGAVAPTTTTVTITANDTPSPPPRGRALLVGTPTFAVGQDTGRLTREQIASDPSLDEPGFAGFAPDGTMQFRTYLGGLIQAPKYGGGLTDRYKSFDGGVRVARADFNGDGVDDVALGNGPGAPPRVSVYDGKSGMELVALAPFEETFLGGVFVAAGDLTGDGVPELVVTPDEGGGPRARVFSGAELAQVTDFFGIEDPDFRGGARAAVADVTGDGVGDLLVAAGFGGGPRLSVWDGTSLSGGAFTRKPFPDFFVFEQALRNGVYVAGGDLDGDGSADVIAGGGPGGGPRVFALSGKGLLSGQQVQLANFFAGDVENRGGVRLTVKDLDGDDRADLVTGAGTGNDDDGRRRVTAYAGKSVAPDGTPPELFRVTAPFSFADGVFVG